MRSRQISLKRTLLPLAGVLAAFCPLTNSAQADATGDFNAKIDNLVKSSIAPQSSVPPASGPKAAAGKNVVVIPCSMSAEGCARLARGAVEAAHAIGWQVTLIDPAGDSAKMAQAVEKAISIKAEGIILASIDAGLVQGPLQEAKKAGILAVADGTNSNGLYDYTLFSDKFYFDQGYLVGAADYVLGKKPLKLIMLEDNEFGGVRTRADGTKAFIDQCDRASAGCKMLATENTLVAGLTTTVPQQAVNLVRLHPDYTALWAGYDAALNFIAHGLQQADLADSGFAIGFDANVANVALIRQGLFQTGTVGAPLEWGGYAMVDNLNRLFNGQAIVADQGISSRLLNKDNLPKTGVWEGDVDYRAAYKKVWGIQ